MSVSIYYTVGGIRFTLKDYAFAYAQDTANETQQEIDIHQHEFDRYRGTSWVCDTVQPEENE